MVQTSRQLRLLARLIANKYNFLTDCFPKLSDSSHSKNVQTPESFSEIIALMSKRDERPINVNSLCLKLLRFLE